MISLDTKNWSLKDKKEVTCTVMLSCLKYNGVNLPATIDIEISWVLDSKKQRTPRMFFLTDEGTNIRNSSIRLNRGKSVCRNETVYIADGIRDKLTPLEVEMKYNLRTASSSSELLHSHDEDVLLWNQFWIKIREQFKEIPLIL